MNTQELNEWIENNTAHNSKLRDKDAITSVLKQELEQKNTTNVITILKKVDTDFVRLNNLFDNLNADFSTFVSELSKDRNAQDLKLFNSFIKSNKLFYLKHLVEEKVSDNLFKKIYLSPELTQEKFDKVLDSFDISSTDLKTFFENSLLWKNWGERDLLTPFLRKNLTEEQFKKIPDTIAIGYSKIPAMITIGYSNSERKYLNLYVCFKKGIDPRDMFDFSNTQYVTRKKPEKTKEERYEYIKSLYERTQNIIAEIVKKKYELELFPKEESYSLEYILEELEFAKEMLPRKFDQYINNFSSSNIYHLIGNLDSFEDLKKISKSGIPLVSDNIKTAIQNDWDIDCILYLYDNIKDKQNINDDAVVMYLIEKDSFTSVEKYLDSHPKKSFGSTDQNTLFLINAAENNWDIQQIKYLYKKINDQSNINHNTFITHLMDLNYSFENIKEYMNNISSGSFRPGNKDSSITMKAIEKDWNIEQVIFFYEIEKPNTKITQDLLQELLKKKWDIDNIIQFSETTQTNLSLTKKHFEMTGYSEEDIKKTKRNGLLNEGLNHEDNAGLNPQNETAANSGSNYNVKYTTPKNRELGLRISEHKEKKSKKPKSFWKKLFSTD